MLDLSFYPLTVAATTTLDPVDVENPGLKIEVTGVENISLNMVFNTGSDTNVDGYTQTKWAGAINGTFTLPDLVDISGGLSMADEDKGLLKDLENPALGNQRMMKMGIGVKADIKAVPDLTAAVEFGMKMWPVEDYDDAVADSPADSGAAPEVSYSAFKLNVPITYAMGDISINAGLTYEPIAWLVGDADGIAAAGGFSEDYYKKAEGLKGVPTHSDRITITAGGSMNMPDMGVKPAVDLKIIMPESVTVEIDGVDGTWTTVNLGLSGDITGEAEVLLPKDAAAGMVINIKPSLAITVSDHVTITPAFPIWMDPNYTKVDPDSDTGELIADSEKASKIGIEVVVAASF
jgi:hypothetical protein